MTFDKWALYNIFSMKARQFRLLLATHRPIVLVGAHDAISAKLVEATGFDGAWVSSFGISAAQKSMPDANVLTMTESLEVAKNIQAAVSIPVIADCDNGYGNAINVRRTATEFAAAGIAGISIEDSIFPKRCSLYPGRHDLVSLEEMVGRIRAIKSAPIDPDFTLIARTEALIAGLGLEEAARRAQGYEEAGADALLIHSKAKSPYEVLAFAAHWKGKIPLVVVPTMFPTASVEELAKAGFKIIIFANQALRACVAAMKSQLNILRKEGRAEVLDGNIASLQEIYDLVGVNQLQAQEEAFLPPEEPVTACILAAGFEEDLLPLTEEKPKAMLEIKGRTILERQVSLLRSAGIHSIVVVRGWRAEAVALPGVHLVENPDYKTKGIAASLLTALPSIQGRLLVLYGDILFDRAILEKMLKLRVDVSLVADRAWYDLYRTENRSPEGADLIVTNPSPVVSHRFLPAEEPVKILEIGQRLDKKTVTAEFIGLACLSPKGVAWLKEIYKDGLRLAPGHPYHEACDFSQASLTDLFQEMIDRKHPVEAVEIYKGWLEVDTFEDYRRAWAKL